MSLAILSLVEMARRDDAAFEEANRRHLAATAGFARGEVSYQDFCKACDDLRAAARRLEVSRRSLGGA